MKRYYLGMAAGYTTADVWRHVFTIGREKDRVELIKHLEGHYGGKATLCKNGRSALALALKAYFKPGDIVLVNGFTCYAVYEAVKAAGLKPVFVDISKDDLNFTIETLERAIAPSITAISSSTSAKAQRGDVKGIVVQNTLGNPVDIKAIEQFAKKHQLIIIEDLAHCAGVKYADGREVGTAGAACALSFGKDKSIDTISGGAVVFRDEPQASYNPPYLRPRASDHLRARFYPMFGAMCRGLSRIRVGGALMRLLVKFHWVEKSADNKLDLTRKISKFEAKLALEQFKRLKKSGEPPLRKFYLVRDREEALRRLRQAGYFFDGFWYERPVSPARYYKKVNFPEAECPNAVYVSEHIVNLPNYYSKQELAGARKIIKEYIEEENDEQE